MVKIAVLPSPPHLNNVTDLENFLKQLNLTHLKDCFAGFTLEKLSTLWEIQLSTVCLVKIILHFINNYVVTWN